jgi:hypothetical protein
LTSAQNALTSALIAHTIARLEFWRDMGILYIKENGNWEEIKDGPAGVVTVEGGTVPEAPIDAAPVPEDVEEGTASP